MKDARFLFAMRGAFDPTVIDSQVVDSIVATAAFGPRFDLVAFTEGSTWFAQRAYLKQRREEIARRTGGRVRAYLTVRQGRFVGNTTATALLWWEVMRARARRTVIHARGDGPGFYAGRVAKLAPGVRVVWDVRGDSEAEFLLHPDVDGLGEQERVRILREIAVERAEAARAASHVLCVSEVLRRRLIERYALSPESVSVVPCVADTAKFHLDEADRERARSALGLQDRFVVVFPGRFGRWHYGPETVAVIQGLMRAHADLFFLALTPDVEEARRLCEAALPVGRYEIRSVTHAEVPGYLRAADLGVLLRERHPLNEAACPTKFAEYVTSGLPVLISEGIGDCSPFVAEHDAGIVLPAPDPAQAAEALAKLREEPAAPRRARIAALAGRFSRQRHAREMAALYERLAAS